MRSNFRIIEIRRAAVREANVVSPFNTKPTADRSRVFSSSSSSGSQICKRISSQPGSDKGALKKWNLAIKNNMLKGNCEAARHVFNSMPVRSSVSWNSMISGYISNHLYDMARQMFDKMPEKDIVSWNVMISGCIRRGRLDDARVLFDEMPAKDVVSWNAMLSGYGQLGHVDEARELFDRMPVKDSISWNGIMAAYVQNGRLEEARSLFDSHGEWGVVSWNCLMSGYVKRSRLGEARGLFQRMPERDVVSWNTMISGYAQSGDMFRARELFDTSPVKDVFTWTAMVSGYMQNGVLDHAREVFDQMPEKNVISWNAMIAGYVQHSKMDLAKQVFDKMPCRNFCSWNTLITGYAQMGEVALARKIFDEMPKRDAISWAAMITAYSQSGFNEMAFNMFVAMQREAVTVTRASVTCTLSACACMAGLELGRQVHTRLIKAGYEAGCYVGNALLTMYSKCGAMDDAHLAFDEIPNKDVVSWNTMIIGYARHGLGLHALTLFDSMKAGTVIPDDATMVGVLSACSHTGLVERGMQLFRSMERDYGVAANMKHYTCVVDLLGRAGRLEEAMKLIGRVRSGSDAALWGALLGASRVHGEIGMGERAAEVAVGMEPENSGMYVLLSNMYASSGRWEEVGRMRVAMKDRGVRKVAGHSWVEVEHRVHVFTAGDMAHPDLRIITAFLEEVEVKMKEEGYVTCMGSVLHDVEEEEKEQMLRWHSERLAVAFGIMGIPAGRPVRVIKNLRVCEDCHNAVKYMSRVTRRVVFLRDSHRFHRFEAGNCSCADYW